MRRHWSVRVSTGAEGIPLVDSQVDVIGHALQKLKQVTPSFHRHYASFELGLEFVRIHHQRLNQQMLFRCLIAFYTEDNLKLNMIIKKELGKN